jgi:hypothetical protein
MSCVHAIFLSRHGNQPVFYRIGAGCEFKQLWTDLSADASLNGFVVNLTRFDADAMPIPLLVPHVRGVATKL